MVEGSTANTTLVRELLVDLRDRGLDVTRPMLVVIDGAKALRRAVREVFDHPVIQRDQQHQIQNVKDKLPERLRGVVERRMRAAYRAASAVDAEAQLEALAGELAKTHPGAAGSLREGIEETLTVIRLGLPPTLAHTMHSTSRVRGSIRYTERLEEAGAVTSVGSRGDSYDNALAESLIGLYKAELVQRKGPWRGLDDLELATLEWVDWFNHRRLFSAIGDVPPAEYEASLDRETVPAPAGTQ